jgi:sulfate/thiosulfate transport system substrate-binding protein
MNLRTPRIILALLLSATVLAACGPGDSNSSDETDSTDAAGETVQESTISLVGFAVPKAANDALQEAWGETDEGKGVSFEASYGASGDQSRAVEAGKQADYVHFSLEGDVTRLVKAGLVAEDWNAGPTKGIVSDSVVVLVVRKGNPKNIEGWDDIVKPGIGIVTPNPGSSGSARWNILAGWAHATKDGGSDEDGIAYITKFFENAVTLAASGREATTAFQGGTGDVLISYENEAIFARQSGEDFEYIIPDDTLLIENPAAVTIDSNPKAAEFLDFALSDDGQKLFASKGFRPLNDVDPGEVEGANDPEDPFPAPKSKLWTVEDFGGWSEVSKKFFATVEKDGTDGIITTIQNESGKGN